MPSGYQRVSNGSVDSFVLAWADIVAPLAVRRPAGEGTREYGRRAPPRSAQQARRARLPQVVVGGDGPGAGRRPARQGERGAAGELGGLAGEHEALARRPDLVG